MKTSALKLLASLALALAISGCATTTRSAISPTDLSGVAKSITVARDEIKAKRYDQADKQLVATIELVNQKQGEIIRLTEQCNKTVDRLNYLEPKYAEAVGILWKWRLIAVASWLVIAGSIAWKFRRWFGVAAVVMFYCSGCSRVEDLPNDCLLDAINFNQALLSKKRLTEGYVWNDVLVVKYLQQGQLYGHCFSVFEWNGQLWAWDQEGSRLLKSPKTSAIAIGKELRPDAIHSYWIREQTK